MKFFLAFIAASVLFIGCANSTQPTPTPPVVPACQLNNTGQLTLENDAADGTTRIVDVDGTRVAELGFGQSYTYTVPAGVTMLVQFFYTNGQPATTVGAFVVTQCGTWKEYTTHQAKR